MVPLLDTHQHLIYPGPLEYGWTADSPALAGRAFTLEDYRAVTRGAGIAWTVAISHPAESRRTSRSSTK